MGVLLTSFWTELLLVALGIFFWLYKVGQKKYMYFEERGIKYLKPTFPLGSTWRAMLGLEQIGKLHRRIYEGLRGAKVGGIFQAFTPILILRDPEVLHRVLIKDFSHFHDRGIRIDEEVNPLEGHLFMLSGEKWRTLRMKLSPTFTSGKLRWMFDQMEVCGEMLVEMLKEEAGKGDVEIRDVMARFTTDVIGSCVFGLEPESINDPDNKFRIMGRKIFLPDLYQILIGAFRFAFPDLFFSLKIKTVPNDIHEFFSSVMKQTLDQRKMSGRKRNDFVQLLLQLRDKGSIEIDPRDHADEFIPQLDPTALADDKIKLTDAVLTAQAFVFFVAGFETSATAMSFTLYLLAKHPEVQEKVRQEVREVKEKFGKLTYEAVKELRQLENCFNESLRMYPPIPVLFRECTKELTLDDGVTIEKGVLCMIPVWGVQMDPDIYPDPESFRPERFDEGQGSAPGTFLPFGDGPRVCIGKRFAMVEVKLGMAKLLDEYSVEMSPKTEEPLELNPRAFVTMPLNGLWLKFTKLHP